MSYNNKLHSKYVSQKKGFAEISSTIPFLQTIFFDALLQQLQ